MLCPVPELPQPSVSGPELARSEKKSSGLCQTVLLYWTASCMTFDSVYIFLGAPKLPFPCCCLASPPIMQRNPWIPQNAKLLTASNLH